MITFNDKKILIIDDESEITFLLQNSFEADGYQVVAANTGVDGIIEARRFNPNIMIIDITMPDLNGYKVIQILREEIEYSHDFIKCKTY
ncbi:response regulator [Bacillus lacus]|uniref:Response regulator n=1 Tax=Metabacillus lacus TaxID=1983721 RepID=A0A7X2J018_9BACI|nr:response regulator [Metabacillus lacus]MRX72865.1 response regulator [Metabacillus lacus]